jgi:hypothetical protein
MSSKLQQYQEVIAKCWDDATFKEKLLSNPKQTLAEIGIEVPENLKIVAHENSDNEFHFVIPSKPTNLKDEQFNLNVENAPGTNGGYSYFTYHGDSPIF